MPCEVVSHNDGCTINRWADGWQCVASTSDDDLHVFADELERVEPADEPIILQA